MLGMNNHLLRIIGIALLAIGLVSAFIRFISMAIIPAVSPFLIIIAFILLALVGGAIYDWARNRHATEDPEEFANFELEFLEEEGADDTQHKDDAQPSA